MTHYDIRIVSDTVCPWCYVGKNRLDAAITQHKSQYPTDTFSTTWLPYYLNPDAPAQQSVDKQARYEAKFGVQRTRMMQHHLARIGQQNGIEFAFGGKTGSSRDSHRLISWAMEKGGEQLQTRVVEELFNAYFEKEEDIVDRDVLVARGVKAGVGSEDEIRAFLESERLGKEVDEEAASAKSGFITGVPNFTIQRRYEVQGAEEPSAFLNIFQRIRAAEGHGDDKPSGGLAAEQGGSVCA